MSSNETAVDYYAILGVQQNASLEAIREAYRSRAMDSHPDRGGDAARWTSITQAYDTLCDKQRRAAYDRSHAAAGGGAELVFQRTFGEGNFDLTDGQAKERKGGMNILQQMAEVKRDEARLKASSRTAIVQSAFEMSHSAGFEAWIRNQKGLGTHGFYTADDLLRQSPFGGTLGGIEATGSCVTPLPPLSATAVSYEAHGAPADVLRVEAARAMPAQLEHGQVLVRMLAASINDEDMLRVQTPLTILNNFPPFTRQSAKWSAVRLPAVAGIEGVGVVVATAKDVPDPLADASDDVATAMRALPGLATKTPALDVRDWVIVAPDARAAPIGTWATLCVCDAARLIKVPAQQLPLQHYACARSLCTAYRLLEDYGDLRPGDTLIQNGAELPTGQAVVQLCAILKIRSINLLPDDDAFETTKQLLVELGATHVLRDNSKLLDFLEALGAAHPRLALDAIGGDAGRRLAVALRPNATLVVHAMTSGQVPQLSPSLLLHHQISLFGFNLANWVADKGHEAYAQMLTTLSQLVAADKLRLFTRLLNVADLDDASLMHALASSRAPVGRAGRERTVLLLGDETEAVQMAFELREAIRKIEESEEDWQHVGDGGGGGAFLTV